MFIRAIFATATVLFSSSCFAQGFAAAVDAETTANSIKCELGRFAGTVPLARLGAQASKIKIVVTNTSDNSNAGGLTFKSIIVNLFHFGGTVSREETSNNKVGLEYNFNPENSRQNCRKHKRVSDPGIGVAYCLERNRDYFKAAAENGGPKLDVDCSVNVVVKNGVSAGAGIPLHIFELDGSYDWNQTSSYKLEVSVPPAKGGDK